MTASARLEALKQKHRDLDNQLLKLSASPSISDSDIAELKRRKLQLKDEIARMQSQAA